MRNWEFQGSNDGKNWDVIDSRVNDQSMSDTELLNTASYDITLKKNSSFYSHFRVKLTELNSSGCCYLMMGGCEIYGYLREL